MQHPPGSCCHHTEHGKLNNQLVLFPMAWSMPASSPGNSAAGRVSPAPNTPDSRADAKNVSVHCKNTSLCQAFICSSDIFSHPKTFRVFSYQNLQQFRNFPSHQESACLQQLRLTGPPWNTAAKPGLIKTAKQPCKDSAQQQCSQIPPQPDF